MLGRVGRHAHGAADAGDRRGDHDTAAAPLAHQGNGRSDAQPDTAHVDRYDVIKHLDRVIRDGMDLALNTGVGQENVYAAVSLNGHLEELPHRIGLGRIRHRIADVVPRDVIHRLLQRSFVDVHQQHPGAFRSENSTRGSTDAARPARYHRHFTGQSCHVPSPASLLSARAYSFLMNIACPNAQIGRSGLDPESSDPESNPSFPNVITRRQHSTFATARLRVRRQ